MSGEVRHSVRQLGERHIDSAGQMSRRRVDWLTDRSRLRNEELNRFKVGNPRRSEPIRQRRSGRARVAPGFQVCDKAHNQFAVPGFAYLGEDTAETLNALTDV
jgi:hypothetical protein